MKKKLSPRQLLGAVILLLFFILLTTFLYNRLNEDARFEKFTEELFKSELCSNPINLHYTLSDASKYGIDESSLTLPVYHAGEALENMDKADEVLISLQKFHPEKLSSVNQYTYILLSSYLTASKESSSYLYYDEPLSPSSGIQSGLPLLLSEYRISSVADIKNYLSILSQIPSYLEGIILYEQEKADHGLFMSDASVNKVIDQCVMLMDPQQLESGNHFLETTFAQRLDNLIANGIINESEKQAWLLENNRLLSTIVAPAYDKLADELTLLKGSGNIPQGLAYYPDGKEYYQANLRLTTGSYRSIQEIKEMLVSDFEKNYTAMILLFQKQPDLNYMLADNDTSFPELSPEDMLLKLQSMITDDYPAITYLAENSSAGGSSSAEKSIRCSVKYVDEYLAPYSAPAFYLTPPIDNASENIIYINPLDTTDGLTLFTTLAHEGYPGHLYQTVYHQNYLQAVDACPLRSILYYGGYVEGWAMYVELNSYDYAIRLARDAHPEAETLYMAEKLNRQIQLCLYSLLDIIIHYEGASYERVNTILSAIGFTEEENIHDIYEYIVEEPCNYPKYYLGYLEIESLKRNAKTIWGDSYTPYRFHTFMLDNGPADFRTLDRLLMLTHA
ncbi:MAG: DUF885 domain-containing protein [Lachnospiraceae bacterium]|nr:DUF885 domain-containing protein [Lachnospiraceae bacterium]